MKYSSISAGGPRTIESKVEEDEIPVPVTIVGHMEAREIVHMTNANTLAIGNTVCKLVFAFPQTNKAFQPKTFIVEVPEEVLVEYADCSYDLQREAHPELNLPDRALVQPPIWSK